MEFKWLCAIFFLVLHCEAQKRCAHRNFSPHEGGTDYGCVCNATYCDEIEPVGELEPGQIVYYVSSKKGERLNRRDSGFSRRPYGPKITVNAEKKYQKVMGFGGAISDSVGYNLRTLSDATQDRLLNAYYGNGGLDYTYTRVVVASSDFSTHPYSYDDFPNDFTMSNFRLTREDYLYKIPYIKKAQELTAQRGDNLHLFCTAWSPPAWMKTSNKMEGGAPMKEDGEGDYYATYALYYKKYLEAYHNEGIDYWGMTPTNEPMQGHNATWTFQVVHMKPDQQRDFLKNHFGPMLKSSEITKNIKIMIGEETRDFIPEIIYTIMNDTDAAKYVDGFAVHWYEDNFTSPLVLDHFNDCYRDRFIFYTEGSTAFKPGEAVPFLGDWGRGAEYASNIITNMNHYSTGWVDWNLVLNQQGGPNWVNNFLDAAIIAIPDADEFIKQPMYYALGHFSKFVRPDYNRIDLKIPDWNVEGIAFLSPDGAQRVVVLHNTNPTESYVYSIEDEALKDQYANFNVKPNSLMTIVYKV